MSRTQRAERLETPIKKTYFMNMQDGKVGFINEGGNIEEAKLPLYLIPLDDRAFRISGATGIGKNARKIKSTLGHPELKNTVKVYYDDNKNILGEGKWSDLKAKLSAIGARYMSVLTAYDPQSKEIISFQLRGKAFAAYVKLGEQKQAKGDLPNKLCELNQGLIIKETTQTPSESGIDSFVPVFGFFEVKPKINEEANDADAILQEYYKEYFKQEQGIEKAQETEQGTERESTLQEAFNSVQNQTFGGSPKGFDDVDDFPTIGNAPIANTTADDLPF